MSKQNQIRLFESNHFGKVRILPDGDSFWVVGKDVLRALEYSSSSDPNRTFQQIPAEWKDTKPIRTPGGTQKILCLSEQGLYFFLGRSDKPKAQKFKIWFDQEVLPVLHPVKVAETTLPESVNSDVQLFENSDFGKIRVIMKDGDPWFVAKDVCGCLHIDILSGVRGLDPDEKDLHSMRTPGGNQKLSIISESGLYSLVLRSRKPQAKQFKCWVTHDVLPSIRKTGSYVVETIQQEKDSTIADRVPLLIAIFQAAKIEGNQLALALDKIHVRESGYSALQTAEVQLIAPQQRQLYTPTEIGKNVSPIISGIKVNKILKELGWQIKVNDKWEAVQSGEQYAVYLDTGKVHSNGTPVRQLKWTSDVIFIIQSYLNKETC